MSVLQKERAILCQIEQELHGAGRKTMGQRVSNALSLAPGGLCLTNGPVVPAKIQICIQSSIASSALTGVGWLAAWLHRAFVCVGIRFVLRTLSAPIHTPSDFYLSSFPCFVIHHSNHTTRLIVDSSFFLTLVLIVHNILPIFRDSRL